MGRLENPFMKAILKGMAACGVLTSTTWVELISAEVMYLTYGKIWVYLE